MGAAGWIGNHIQVPGPDPHCRISHSALQRRRDSCLPFVGGFSSRGIDSLGVGPQVRDYRLDVQSVRGGEVMVVSMFACVVTFLFGVLFGVWFMVVALNAEGDWDE